MDSAVLSSSLSFHSNLLNLIKWIEETRNSEREKIINLHAIALALIATVVVVVVVVDDV